MSGGLAIRRGAAVCGLALALAASVLAGPAAPAASAACPPQLQTLSPKGSAAERYTMLLRVNKVRNAEQYANRDQASGGLGARIHPQDVFVVNTRFRGSTPTEWSQIVSTLREAFPCNRIVTLNGLGGDPYSPGYAYALSGSPHVWALLTDWERIDWNLGRGTNPQLHDWTGRFKPTRKRVRRWVGSIASAFGRSALPGPRRTGIAPQYKKKWDYGELARTVSGQNRRLGGRGIQSVQTQDFCADRGAGGMKVITKRLFGAYKSANFKRVRKKGSRKVRHRKRRWKLWRANLAVQVSFSGTPTPGAGMALLSTSPARAAGCTRSALKRGAGAILYWASPNSIRLLLTAPEICAMRPSPTGVC